MARLHVRLDADTQTGVEKVEIAPAIRQCLYTCRIHRTTSNVMKVVLAIGSVIILVLVRLLDLKEGDSCRNTAILYGVLTVASLTTLALALTHQFDFERKAYRYGSAARALERVRDLYSLEASRPSNAQRLNELTFWAKQNVNEIERLLDDTRVVDVDLQFQPSGLPSDGAADNRVF